jgi:hypothetical protein
MAPSSRRDTANYLLAPVRSRHWRPARVVGDRGKETRVVEGLQFRATPRSSVILPDSLGRCIVRSSCGGARAQQGSSGQRVTPSAGVTGFRAVQTSIEQVVNSHPDLVIVDLRLEPAAGDLRLGVAAPRPFAPAVEVNADHPVHGGQVGAQAAGRSTWSRSPAFMSAPSPLTLGT